MGLFKKKGDPISDRAKALNAEIAALEAQIKKLSATGEQRASRPRLDVSGGGQTMAGATQTHSLEPVFEEIDRERLKARNNPATAPARARDLEVRKWSLLAAWQRFLGYFRGPPPANPKLLNYLAAGSIQGLRPLRYEKRIARYRLLFLSICLFFVLWIIFEWVRHR